MLSTPPEELEEQRKAVSEAARKIKQGETFRAKALEDIFVVSEVLMEDVIVKSIRENMCGESRHEEAGPPRQSSQGD